MENKHPISEILEESLTKLKQLVDVDTIIGKPITAPDGTIIIPISKVSFGFATCRPLSPRCRSAAGRAAELRSRRSPFL